MHVRYNYCCDNNKRRHKSQPHEMHEQFGAPFTYTTKFLKSSLTGLLNIADLSPGSSVWDLDVVGWEASYFDHST